MNIKEYRKAKGLTQPQLAEELTKVCFGIDSPVIIDAPLISKMERGFCEPPLIIQTYLEAQGKEMERKESDLTDIQIDILRRLTQASPTDPATRSELVLLSGLADGNLRKEILKLRLKGYRIFSNSGQKGYWLCRNETEYKIFREEHRKRAMTELATISAMDNYVEGQISING